MGKVKEREKMLFCVLWIYAMSFSNTNGAYVSSLEPRYGSLAGETRLTIYGSGFSADQFSQDDDPDVGNRVYLVGESGSEFSCPVHKDGCTEKQIMCYTPRGMPQENHYVKVVVDGNTISDSLLCNGNPTSHHCTHQPHTHYTPTITDFSPQSGMPGTNITMDGKLFSDRYGSNLAAATNERKEKLLRVYVGPQDCALKNGDEFYGLSLNDENSDYGTIVCKHKGTSVGFYNASFIIESPFGRSLPDAQLYKVAYNDQIYMFQSYTNITSVSQSTGSTAGGLSLTIYGNYFDDRAPYAAPRAYVGDTVCEITDVVVDEYVECKVAPDPQYSAPNFSGNRGVNYEYWTSTYKSLDDLDSILDMTDSDPGYVSDWLDETYFYDEEEMDNYVSKMTTYFTAPHTGSYQFLLLADDGARLYVNGIEAVTSRLSWQESNRMPLTEGSNYLLEVVHYENGGQSYVELKAKYFDTEFTSGWTSKAEQETQTISITSTVTYDIQTLEFTSFGNQSYVHEVQTVSVSTGGQYRFGLFGVFTEPLAYNADESTVSAAINALPVFSSDEAVIVEQQLTSTPTFQFTFVSRRGDFPDIKVVKVIDSSDVTYNVTEDTRGEPDLDTISLSLQDVVSKPFSVASVDANSLTEVLDDMFDANCPSVFEGQGIATYYESFEADSIFFHGQRVKDTEPFCGRYSLKNPWRIYQQHVDTVGIMLSSYSTLCFAYKGFLRSFIGVRYTRIQASNNELAIRTSYFPHTFNTDSDTRSTTWYYTCENIYSLVYDLYPSDTEHRIIEVFVFNENSQKDAYIDAVFIGREEITDDPEVYLRRVPPARPNGTLVDAVSVAAVSASQFNVTLTPYECGNKFPLIELANSVVTAGQIISPSDSVTMKLANGGGSGIMKNTRSSTASPPVTGLVDITFDGNTRAGLNVTLDSFDFDRELESLSGIGSLEVTKSGTCANFDLAVTFLTLPGDIPEMTVTYGQLAGTDAAGSIRTDVDGGLYYAPLAGDLLTTVHSDPQVRLFINDVPTLCGGDCSFTWDSASTPTVTGVSPTSGTLALGTSIDISGAGFSGSTSDNNVTIAGVPCTVTAATTSNITCDVGNGPVGAYDVIVNVAGNGDAAISGNVEFTYTANISSISPTSGSLGGGVSLVISGYGFKSDANVTINSTACTILSVNASEIVCIVPHSTTAGTYDVEIEEGQTILSYSGFTYDVSLTASVTSITPPSLTVHGGNLTISGAGFGVNASTVYLGSHQATIVSWSDTDIDVYVEVTAAGVLDLIIETSNGYAIDSSFEIPTVEVDLSINNVYPLRGSLQGGTKLTLTGSGFGLDDSDVDISVGDYMCDIDTISNTQIVCQIENAGSVHQVTNMGTDPAFGVYYAFDEPYITINVGDYVRWSWETPSFVNNIAHAIIEVSSPSSTTAKPAGFNSGTPSKNGEFTYQFTETGTYYVWSGFVDEWGIKNYAGTIEVVTAASSLGEVSVTVGGVEALHNVGGASDPVDNSSCGATLDATVGCTDSLPSGGDPTIFTFAFWTCSTPLVTYIDVNNGTVQTEITISGGGFSATDCQNEVTFGGYECDVTSSSETDVTCTLSKSGEPELAILHQLEMRVGNRGSSLISIMAAEDRGFGVIPNIETIQPTSGSMAGGSRITITGFGFGDTPYVMIGSYQCEIIESSYIEIICETPASNQDVQREVTVQAYVNGAPFPAECETLTETCRYSYDNNLTPEIESIDPSVMSSTTTFNITGALFGNDTSQLEVSFGGVLATITSAEDSYLLASIDNIPAGDNDVVVRVIGSGKATGSLSVTGSAVITSVSPSSGSTYGDTKITIQGNGFVENDTTVTFGGSDCHIMTTTLAEITCITSSHAAGSVNVDVTSNGESYSSASFSYSAGSTPTISSVSPTAGLEGATLTISGSNFASSGVAVSLDGVDCAITSSSPTQVQCTLGSHATGDVPVAMYVDGLGSSNTNVMFEYQLTLSSINPVTGGTAGGQYLVLTGSGFTDGATVTVCGVACPLVSTTTTSYTCKTPASSAQTCSVAITLNGLTKTLSNSYTYDAGLTPSVSGVDPVRGGTGGGTRITITGTGFGSTASDVSVMIDDVECVVDSANDTEVQCVTGAHVGSVDSKVELQVSGNGIAEESSSGDADFSYIDVWSSTFTWGGGPLPEEGDFVVIPQGMTLLLDTDTPILSFLLIQGGKLIFDEKDVELQSNIIMITDNGLLQVGTEAEPFQHKAIITLHGHHRSKELPIYGTKVLAVRNGTLDLHGIEVPLTWTRLAATASAGNTSIQLVDPVEWNVGDEIAIASSGHHHTQSENEKKIISAISVDKMTLTLSDALEADHWGTEETFDGTLVEFRAEVGLLTHNVVVRGNQDPQWEDKIEACEAGFDTGEFAVQTCFLGRFGEEIGSSQFGAMILVHAPVYDTHEAQARISYTEVFFAGQAFRLGRYPVHFHLNGDMSTSYVRGCGIHKTFNRAVNIHGTHNTMVEKNVIYDIMGGAFFLEDGVETGNTFQYNLAIFVRETSSLLNDDVTPASFWVTNPNNIIQHNAAAGGTHFGYWYRMHNHPDGPSFTPDVCPKNVPLGRFYNNSAHSFGWYGLWIFEDYFPLEGGCGGSQVEPAVFEKLYSWNNNKGAEAVNSGAVQFKDFVLVQNRLAGYEGKLVLNVPLWTDESPMIFDSLIVAKTNVIADSVQGCTNAAVVFPYDRGFRVVNVRFVNFDESSCAVFAWTRIAGLCSFLCGGYTYHIEQLQYINSPNKARYAWDWEGIILDKDGSSTGKPANWTVLPASGSLPDDCEDASEFSIGQAAKVCPPEHKWHRFAFNDINPESIEGKDFIITNQYGNSSVSFAKKRLTHKPGWMCALVKGATYKFHFEHAEQIKNISFSGQFYDFDTSDYIFMRLGVKEMPDRFSIDGGANYINMTTGGIDPATAENGDWEWDNNNDEIRFVVHGRRRSTRGLSTYSIDRPYSFTMFKCYYKDCIPPKDPNTVPPAGDRPVDFDYWDDTSMWNMTDGYMTYMGGTSGLPADYDNVKILTDTWVVVNMTQISKLGVLLLEGVLEFMDTPGAVYEIEADHIIIKGGRLVIGWPDDPFDGLASITLRGNYSSDYNEIGDGPTIGAKAIGVFGGLDLFGRDVWRTWTHIDVTANVGDDTIVLSEPVNWMSNDDIVLGPTSFNAWETESFRIVNVASDNVTLTLNDTLKYKHIAHFEQLSNGQSVNVSAGVGLLTHNIKIIGDDYDKLYKQSFGARVIVGLVTSEGKTYTGYARLSNVEFYHTGQEGFTEEYDPRFSVAYVAVGTVSNVKPSKVTKCSFHNGFNTAVGAFGIGSLEISDNVVFGSVGNGLQTSSNDTRLINNMVALMVATNSYQDRFEPFNFRYEAGIEAMEATDLILQDNLVTGSERIGFHVPPLACDDTSGRYSNNKAFSNLLGLALLPDDEYTLEGSCAKYAGFTVWKSLDFGIYYQSDIDFVADDNAMIENTNGLFSIVVGPSATGHQYANKTITVSNSLFVGQTSSFDCIVDIVPQNDDNIVLSANSRPVHPPSNGMIGLVFPNFYQASNKAPEKPFKGIMSYNAIGGLMMISGNTFAHYETTSCKTNYAVATNVANDDGQHPVEATTSTLIDTPHANKIVYHRPNLGKINSADCVDMDCDALKKALFKDLDSTFLGHVGSVIPQSEYEWNGDPRRGLGDYRIPKEMMTRLDGSRIEYDILAPRKGVIRNENCTFQSSWQAYECMDDINHEMLIIESMDSDTETRRISPVAILGHGYIDLINGPQDHGWCSGYTCRKRLSTFMALVATDEEYLMHFTGTTPEHMRYRLLNVDSDKVIKLTVWYSRPNRLDLFVDDEYVLPTNVKTDSNGYYISSMPTGNEYEPMLVNDTGTNYFDRDRGEITFIIKGSQKIDIISQDTIIVSFGLPAMTVDDFYGDNLIENLAAFLNIPLTKVRIVNVVSESGNSGRRKRSSDGISVQVEIGDEPTTGINETASDTVSYDQLVQLTADMVNECQVGNVSESLNMTGSCESVELSSEDPAEGSIKYNTPSPDHLFFHTEPEPQHEGVLLHEQPKIRAADIGNNVLTELGTSEYPWQLTVSLRAGTGHPDASLNGSMEVNATDGWFNFTDLIISHMGTGYILDFNVTYPQEAENFTLASDPFDVDGRPVKIHVVDKSSGDIVRDAQFFMTLDLRDEMTDEIITDITWRGHTWYAEVTMLGSSPYGDLAGSLSTTFDPASGQALFSDLNMTGFGMFYVQFRVYTDPADYNMTLNHKLTIVNPAHIGMTIEEEYEVEVKFNVDYNKVLSTPDKENEFEQMVLTEYSNLWPDVQLSVGSIYEGSIVVTFIISGSYSNVNSTAYSICDSIYNGTSYDYNGYSLQLSPYLTINNQTYYGVTCGDLSEEEEEDSGLATYLIIIIITLAVLILLLVIGGIIWQFNVKNKNKTTDVNTDTQYMGRTEKPMEDMMFQEDTFSSIRCNRGMAPAATNIVSEKRPLSAFSVRVGTPDLPRKLADQADNHMAYLSPPPAYYDSPPMYVEPQSSGRNASPSTSRGSGSPMLHRSHSPFDDRDSPLPPIGKSLYHSDYITSPVPRNIMPHLPAPSPKLGKR